MKKLQTITKINILIFIAFILVMGLKLYMADTVATAGSDYTQMHNEKIILEKENEYLRNEYLAHTSLKKVENTARELGYTEKAIDYLTPFELASR